MISRRDSLKWLAAGVAMAPAFGAVAQSAEAAPADWPVMGLLPLTGPGYGTDPDLMNPQVTWPLTLSAREKALVTALGDLILPPEDGMKGAGEFGVADFVDEWLSAPYPSQSNDRLLIVPGLAWLDLQAGGDFISAPHERQIALLDTLCMRSAGGWGLPAAFFDRLRVLVLIGYYSAPEGVATLGFQGNTPMTGDYPGPSDEALAHLEGLCKQLGLKV